MLTAVRLAVNRQKHVVARRTVSTRASTILSALGLNSDGEIHGVYDGRWRGSGEIMVSMCPTTGEELARVRTASREELREALERTREAYTIFRSKSL
jgi:aldehyde dehydrogenase family 7 protein A1